MTDRLVLVEWYDPASVGEVGWKSRDEAIDLGLQVVRSVGWVLAECEKTLTIAAHLHDDSCDGDLTLPKGCIKRVVDLVESPIDDIAKSQRAAAREASPLPGDWAVGGAPALVTPVPPPALYVGGDFKV